MTCPADAHDWLTLSLLPGLGPTLITRLVDSLGTPAAVLAGGAEAGRVAGIGPHLTSMLADRQMVGEARSRAQAELTALDRMGVNLLTCHCPRYPPLLRSIADAPALLYARGDLGLLSRPAVALVGSRAASDYGRRMARALAAELASRGLTIVSGAAHGIDAEAHHGALEAGGGTVAVLGCGPDVVYPRSHGPLLSTVAAKGLIVSEYPLGTAPEGFRFPERNRIISGLAGGVVVVEATRRSGSLITARLALDQGREVFAVPGRIDSPKSEGPHGLIRQGAHLVRSAEDILEGLAWSSAPPAASIPRTPPVPPLDPEEDHLLAQLDAYGRDIDSLSGLTGLPVEILQPLLLKLELKGLVRQLPGQQFERVGG